MKARLGLLLVALVALNGQWATGSLITFRTAPGATMNGQPIAARATFATSADHVTLVLENLEADPTSVTQNLRGIFFTVSTGQTAGTLASSSDTVRTVNRNGSFSDGAAADTGWVLTSAGGQFDLTGVGGGPWPAHTIIGPPDSSNDYSNANGSIAGNKAHNPFLGPTAIFELDVPGVTAASTISEAIFSFNTTLGDDIPGIKDHPTPEPATLMILGLGASAAVIRRRTI